MKTMRLLYLAFFFLSYFSLQAQFDEVVIKTTKITDQVYMLEGSGGNIALFDGPDGLLMVDDQFAPLSEKIKAAAKDISDQPITYLVNTHWHGDHTGGNENFGKEGALIIAHENVRLRKSTDQFSKAFNRTTPASPEIAWPKITFSEDMKLHFNGDDIMLLHVHNAHTDGDSFVYWTRNNVLHMGDCFFNERFPYIDLGSGGSVDGLIKAVEAALMIVDNKTVIIPGHGSLANRMDLIKYFTMLKTMKSRITEAIADGKTIEEIKASGLDKGYETYGSGFISTERIVDIMWTDFTRNDTEE